MRSFASLLTLYYGALVEIAARKKNIGWGYYSEYNYSLIMLIN